MKYLVRWKDDTIHTAIMNICGIRRLMRGIYEDHRRLQVCVYQLAESDIYATPSPLRIWYDYKFDKLSLFGINGALVEKVEDGFPLKKSA